MTMRCFSVTIVWILGLQSMTVHCTDHEELIPRLMERIAALEGQMVLQDAKQGELVAHVEEYKRQVDGLQDVVKGYQQYGHIADQGPYVPSQKPAMAGPVIFSAIRTVPMGPAVGDTPVFYDDIRTNIGGGFPGDSSFFAPVAGVYAFTYNSKCEADHGATSLQLNDAEVTATSGPSAGYGAIGTHVILDLEIGDQVRMVLRDGASIYDFPFTVFSGFLLLEIT